MSTILRHISKETRLILLKVCFLRKLLIQEVCFLLFKLFLRDHSRIQYLSTFNGLRTESNVTRAQLAEQLNVSVRLISYWENGKRECDFNTLIKLADFFSVSVDFLLGRTEY